MEKELCPLQLMRQKKTEQGRRITGGTGGQEGQQDCQFAKIEENTD